MCILRFTRTRVERGILDGGQQLRFGVLFKGEVRQFWGYMGPAKDIFIQVSLLGLWFCGGYPTKGWFKRTSIGNHYVEDSTSVLTHAQICVRSTNADACGFGVGVCFGGALRKTRQFELLRRSDLQKPDGL